jgi:hypothetical protein
MTYLEHMRVNLKTGGRLAVLAAFHVLHGVIRHERTSHRFWGLCLLVALVLTSGCTSTTSSVVPCVPEVQLVEVEVPVSQPVAVPEELKWPDLPEYPPWPGSGCSEAELEAWAIETARVAREREEALVAMLEACLGFLRELSDR